MTARPKLRVPRGDELSELAAVAAAGVHGPGANPFLTPRTDLPPRDRALYVMQQYWSRRGSWDLQDWALELGVFHGGRSVGTVALKARSFSVLREVRTESWLGVLHHWQDIGTESRAAMPSLAFEVLGAINAVTEAFQDNKDSQGVSQKLAYGHGGVSRSVLAGRAMVSDRLRLDRQDWAKTNAAHS